MVAVELDPTTGLPVSLKASDVFAVITLSTPDAVTLLKSLSALAAQMGFRGLATRLFVDYGLTTAYGLTAQVPTLVTSHSVILLALDPVSVYHYKVRSTAPDFVANSADRTFTSN